MVFTCLFDYWWIDYDIDSDESSEQVIKFKVQNITFKNVTGGKNLTPKHINLACTLYQTTRSKELIQSSIMQATLSAMKMFYKSTMP